MIEADTNEAKRDSASLPADYAHTREQAPENDILSYAQANRTLA
jgi:hypothetical protein